jgi:hypothetical protein
MKKSKNVTKKIVVEAPFMIELRGGIELVKSWKDVLKRISLGLNRTMSSYVLGHADPNNPFETAVRGLSRALESHNYCGSKGVAEQLNECRKFVRRALRLARSQPSLLRVHQQWRTRELLEHLYDTKVQLATSKWHMSGQAQVTIQVVVLNRSEPSKQNKVATSPKTATSQTGSRKPRRMFQAR